MVLQRYITDDPGLVIKEVEDDGTFPGNGSIPLLILTRVFLFDGEGDAEVIERAFSENGWGGSWRNGIYPFHHYHSTAHEVLGIYRGSVRVQFGGETGPEIAARSGDVFVIPAGVAHKNLWSSHDFRVVGAYPSGQTWDMNYGKEGERPQSDRNIERVPLPESDPVYGERGILMNYWK